MGDFRCVGPGEGNVPSAVEVLIEQELGIDLPNGIKLCTEEDQEGELISINYGRSTYEGVACSGTILSDGTHVKIITHMKDGVAEDNGPIRTQLQKPQRVASASQLIINVAKRLSEEASKPVCIETRASVAQQPLANLVQAQLKQAWLTHAKLCVDVLPQITFEQNVKGISRKVSIDAAGNKHEVDHKREEIYSVATPSQVALVAQAIREYAVLLSLKLVASPEPRVTAP